MEPLHEEGPVRLQDTLAVAAHLARGDRPARPVALGPLHRRRNRIAETRRNRPAALTGQNRINNTLTKIIRKGSP